MPARVALMERDLDDWTCPKSSRESSTEADIQVTFTDVKVGAQLFADRSVGRGDKCGASLNLSEASSSVHIQINLACPLLFYDYRGSSAPVI
jgi:hypothetical protein